MNFTICRIVGNELPPRDTVGSKLACLKWLLEVDRSPHARYVYMLNQVIDPAYRDTLRQALVGQEVIEVPFSFQRYRECGSDAERIRYAININAARNHAIRYCQGFSDFVACLDQESYYHQLEIPRIIDRIRLDQRKHPQRQYYGTVSKRFHILSIPADTATLPDAEPMVIVRKDAVRLFDPTLKFGDGDKVELLEYMGYNCRSSKITVSGDRAMNVGTCLHISFGDARAESDVHWRGDLRSQSLQQLLQRIDELHSR